MTIAMFISITDYVVKLIFITTFFYHPFCIFLPSRSTSAGHGSLPGGMT